MMVERECCFDEDGRWFRYRAAAIILDGGKVLMARNDAEPYYYSIGGGVHHMETAEDAVCREVREETGADLKVARLGFVHENFFSGSDTAGLQGRQCHELTFYFVMKLAAGVELAGHSTTQNGIREWLEWVDLATFGRDRIAYPTFFATELLQLGDTAKWITTHEPASGRE